MPTLLPVPVGPIGDLLRANPIIVAPMAGITDKAFRQIARSFGAGLIYTEMVSAKAVTYRNQRTYDLFDLSGEESGPIVVQIFGSEPEVMAAAARHIVEVARPYAIDINMGCPVPKVVKNLEGSALMKDPSLAARIVTAVKAAIPATTPLTVKFRSGWDENTRNYLDFALRMEDAGAAALAVHPRTRNQMYAGKADWDVIAQVKQAVRVPVIASGDVYTLEDFRRLRQQTACDGVMLARGILGNFHLIQEIACHLANKDKEYERPTPNQRLDLLARHLDLLVTHKGETVAVKEIRKFFAWYTKSLPGAARLRTQVNTMKDATTFKAFLDQLKDEDYFGTSLEDSREQERHR